jgi:hypothetical protein
MGFRKAWQADWQGEAHRWPPGEQDPGLRCYARCDTFRQVKEADMLQSVFRGLLNGPLYRDFRFQIRLVVVIAALFVFVFPSLIGMNLFYLDLFAGHPELEGFPNQPTAMEAFYNLAGDSAVREVVLGLIFSTGLIFILGASHNEPRLSPVLDALGMLLVMYSIFFLLVASDRCIAPFGCSREFFITASGLAAAFGLGAVLLPRFSKRLILVFSLPYILLLIYQDSLWLIFLARTTSIDLTWEFTHAILLVFLTMLIPISIALIGSVNRRQ